MALGGGVFTTQNKTLPGAYINFVNATRAVSDISSRGVAAIMLPFDWAPEDKLFSVTAEDFRYHSIKVFGKSYDDDSLKDVREVFRHATRVYFYNALTGGAAATSKYGTAKNPGIKGNDLKVVVTAAIGGGFNVETYLGAVLVDTQTVSDKSAVKDNDYVSFSISTALAADAGTAFTGGKNGTTTTETHTKFMAALENVSFNILACTSDDATVQSTYIAFTKRMRDEYGVKFQTVIPYSAGVKADYEGVIASSQAKLVPWLAGAEAGCLASESCTNMIYDGELMTADEVSVTQGELVAGIDRGELMFHRVGDQIRVLTDIDTLVTYTDTKSKAFASNQTMRVLDQIGNDIATIFNDRYVGTAPNNEAGRVAFWNEVVQYINDLQAAGAVQNFRSEDVTVTRGNTDADVVATLNVQPVNAFERLYMTVYIGQ